MTQNGSYKEKGHLLLDTLGDQACFNQPAGMRVIHSVGGIAERLGGPSRTVTSLCSSIRRLGISVDLVAGVDRSSDERLIRPEECRVNLRLVDAWALGHLNLYPGFLSTLKELLGESIKPTLIHDHGIWGSSNFAAWRAARSHGVPYILSPRGMLEPWALQFKARKKKLAWLLYQQRIVASASAVIATSEQEGENVKRLSPKKPVAIIPNGVDMPTLHDLPSNRSIGGNNGTVLFMSRIHPKKNLIGLLHAWKSLNPELSENWRLRIAGPDEGGHVREVAALVIELGLQDYVELIGPVSEDSKATAYRSADIFVLPSFSENFGVVVAEALAYGLPVIATKGTPWDELPNRGCGWWVAPDQQSLTGALTTAMSCSYEDRGTMGAIGRAYAQAEFSWIKIAQQTIEVYRWVLDQGAKPDCVWSD